MIDLDALETPRRVRALPRNDAGYPVPWFVAWIDGKPDFRVVEIGKFEQAVQHRVCWICGEQMGGFKAFVVGPMCAVNRVSSEPPSHHDCAVFAAKACPFLTNPKQVRRERDVPVNTHEAGGVALKRNPGVALVWVTKSYRVFRVRAQAGVAAGWLIDMGDPVDALWFAHGRAANRVEVMEAIDSGLPALRGMAEKDGAAAVAQLERQHRDMLDLLPMDGVSCTP